MDEEAQIGVRGSPYVTCCAYSVSMLGAIEKYIQASHCSGKVEQPAPRFKCDFEDCRQGFPQVCSMPVEAEMDLFRNRPLPFLVSFRALTPRSAVQSNASHINYQIEHTVSPT